MMLNMVVTRPIPKAKAATAAREYPGFLSSMRNAKRRSCRNEPMNPSQTGTRTGVRHLHYAGRREKVTGDLLRRPRPLLPLIQPAPGGFVVVEDGEVGLAAPGGVDVPAPEEGPFQIGAVGLEHAEDEAVHAVQNAQLEDVGAEETPDRAAEDLGVAGLLLLLPVLGGTPEAVFLDPFDVLVERVGHVVLHRALEHRGRPAGDHVGVD